MDRNRLISLMDTEIAAIGDSTLRQRVQETRIVPTPLRCAWDYGEWGGEPGKTYECWKVLAPPGRVGVVYSEQGFGPRCPWGLIWQDEDLPDMGPDSNWFSGLAEAAVEALNISPPQAPIP